jgi:ferric-dicitrate binding protein FerR (iron transport regulator)
MEERSQILISRYFLGSLTESEKEELNIHLESNLDNLKEFEDYRKLWNESDPKISLDPIDLEGDLLKTKRRIYFRKNTLFRFLQQAVAIFFLAGFFSTVFLYFYSSTKLTDTPKPLVLVQEISTAYGTRSKFQLPDGTFVFLNSGSKLLFPNEFNSNSRNVELIGEAFFEVTSDSSKPFNVKTGDINVKVLGTSFDLQAYPLSGEISTTLVHGKVVLEKEFGGITKQFATLKPSDHAIYKSGKGTVSISSEEDLDKFIGWKDGKLVFFNDPIEDVARKLGIWYNVKVNINNKNLKEYHFTATFSDEPIEQVLNLLSKASPIKYKIKKAAKLSDNSYLRREIIIY